MMCKKPTPIRKRRPVARALLWIYKVTLSRFFSGSCRFYPSCSCYAVEAIEVYGWVRGVWLAARRLLRCHPFNPGGVDPVP